MCIVKIGAFSRGKRNMVSSSLLVAVKESKKIIEINTESGLNRAWEGLIFQLNRMST